MRLDLDGLELIKLGLEFAIVPLIGVLWKLSNQLKSIELMMYKEFVTKAEFNGWKAEKSNREG